MNTQDQSALEHEEELKRLHEEFQQFQQLDLNKELPTGSALDNSNMQYRGTYGSDAKNNFQALNAKDTMMSPKQRQTVQSENINPDYFKHIQQSDPNESYDNQNQLLQQNGDTKIEEDKNDSQDNVSFGEPEMVQNLPENQNGLPQQPPPQDDYDDFAAKQLPPVVDVQQERRSTRSFAEEVESQNSQNEFKGRRSKAVSLAGSQAGDPQEIQQNINDQSRTSPRRSAGRREIDVITVTSQSRRSKQHQTRSPDDKGQRNSFSQGSGIPGQTQYPFHDAELSNIINQTNMTKGSSPVRDGLEPRMGSNSRANQSFQNQSISALANAFDNIDPVKPKESILELNESLREDAEHSQNNESVHSNKQELLQMSKVEYNNDTGNFAARQSQRESPAKSSQRGRNSASRQSGYLGDQPSKETFGERMSENKRDVQNKMDLIMSQQRKSKRSESPKKAVSHEKPQIGDRYLRQLEIQEQQQQEKEMMEREFQKQIEKDEEMKRQKEQREEKPKKSVNEMTPEEREAYMEEQMDKIMAKKLGLKQISPQNSNQRYKTPGFNDVRETPNPDIQPQPVVVLDQQIDSRTKPIPRNKFESEFDTWRAQKYQPPVEPPQEHSFRQTENQPVSSTGRLNPDQEQYINDDGNKSMTGPVNTTVQSIAANIQQNVEMASQNIRQTSDSIKGSPEEKTVSDQQLTNRSVTQRQDQPQLHPQMHLQQVSAFSARKAPDQQARPGSRTRMSSAGRSQRHADGRQSRSGSRGRIEENEISNVSIISKRNAYQQSSPTRKSQNPIQQQQSSPSKRGQQVGSPRQNQMQQLENPNNDQLRSQQQMAQRLQASDQNTYAQLHQSRGAVSDFQPQPQQRQVSEARLRRAQQMEETRQRMAEDAARAQEAQAAMEQNARKRRMEQQEKLFKDVKKSNLGNVLRHSQIQSQPTQKGRVLVSPRSGKQGPNIIDPFADADNFGDDDVINDIDEDFVNPRQARGGHQAQYRNQGGYQPQKAPIQNQNKLALNKLNMYESEDDKTVTMKNFPQTARNANTNSFANPGQQYMNGRHGRVLSPQRQQQPPSKEQLYEDLFQKVIREQDPKAALQAIVMKDRQSYDLYREGVKSIEAKIDRETQRQLAASQQQRMVPQQQQMFHNRQMSHQIGSDTQSFAPQAQQRTVSRTRMGSNAAGRNQARSPMNSRQGQEQDYTHSRTQSWAQPQNDSRTGHFYQKPDSRASNGSGAGDPNRSGSRNRFFRAGNNNSRVDSRGMGQSQDTTPDRLNTSQNMGEQPVQVQQFYREYQDVIRNLMSQDPNLNLVDILQGMNMIDPRTHTQRLSIMLNQQRNNLMLGNKSQNDDVVKNLFKILCSVMQFSPNQSGNNLLDPKILTSYLDYIDLHKQDQDILFLDQLATIKSLFNRRAFFLNPQQVQKIASKYQNFALQRQGSNRQAPQMQQQNQYQAQQAPQNTQPQYYRQPVAQQQQDNSFKPVARRPWQGNRPSSRAGSRAGRSDSRGNGVQQPQAQRMQQMKPTAPHYPPAQQNNYIEEPTQKYQEEYQDPSYGGARETYRNVPPYQQQSKPQTPSTQHAFSNQGNYDSNYAPTEVNSVKQPKGHVMPQAFLNEGHRQQQQTFNQRQPQQYQQDPYHQMSPRTEDQMNDSFGPAAVEQPPFYPPQQPQTYSSPQQQAPQQYEQQQPMYFSPPGQGYQEPQQNLQASPEFKSPANPSGKKNQHRNPPSGGQRQKQPICVLKIDLGGDAVEEIRVHDGEDPQQIVMSFGSHFNLSDNAMKRLLGQINQQIQAHQQNNYY